MADGIVELCIIFDMPISKIPISIYQGSVPYMNSALRNAQYKRNMARNRFRRFRKQCWEENRRARNHVVKIRKQSMQKYFKELC